MLTNRKPLPSRPSVNLSEPYNFGTLGMLIPPSVMLVVMGPVVGPPITELFAAAVIPGVLLATLYALYARYLLTLTCGRPARSANCPGPRLTTVGGVAIFLPGAAPRQFGRGS